MRDESLDEDRRRLLTTGLPLATIACLGCRGLAAQTVAPGARNKFLENPGMTTEETYAFCYGTFIPVLQSLAKEMGPERFLAALTKAASENTGQMISAMVKDLPTRDIKALSTLLAERSWRTPPFDKTLTYEIVEQSDKVLELKYTECLPAKLLRAMNAADIGYALECSGSEAAVKAFNSRITAWNARQHDEGGRLLHRALRPGGMNNSATSASAGTPGSPTRRGRAPAARPCAPCAPACRRRAAAAGARRG